MVFALLWEANEIALLIAKDTSSSFSVSVIRIVLGLPIIFTGLYLSILRLIYRKRELQRTVFAITNKRVLKINEDSKETFELDINRDLNINKSVNGNGFGTLRFYPASTFLKILRVTGMELSWFYSKDLPAFYNLNDADKVYNIIENIKKNNQ